ncbi:prolyl oligopeptidase family serine peptidase [Pseudoduganella eburnea]|uniref:Prolyl oligopeptidase family serine peptidase n=1 Tax=Massilia eburnea TaxID=1776165 RepID=A0A6L6QJW6_9BURK|nr:S9 family peptidase [Massilia eburnea]MTW12354.1 prolyl oligopeptidase family serine peptidase [Massilia eburnea]
MQVKAIAQTVFLATAIISGAVAQAASPGVAIRDYRSVAISPAGDRVVSLESIDTGNGKRPHATVVVRDASTGAVASEFDPCSTCSYDKPSWSPDGKSLAFVASDSRAGSAWLYVAAGGKTRSLTVLQGVGSTARWSPDGRTLAMLATVGARKETGATAAGARQIGEIGAVEDAQRIATIPAEGGNLKLVSPEDTFVYEYDWTPDGKGFIATSAKGNGDNNWWVAKLSHVDASSGMLRIVATPGTQANMPRVSPDGRTVAFIGGLMSDFGSVGGDVYTVPLAGGEPVNLTPGFKGSFNSLVWRGKGLLANALMGDKSNVLSLDLQGHRNVLRSAAASTSAAEGRMSFSADGSKAAAAQEDFEHAPAVMAGPIAAMRAVTDDNSSLQPQVSVQNISWKNEGFNVQGWLIGPRATQAGKKYPLIVQVHGGPAAAVSPRYISAGEQGNPQLRLLTEKGYFVFMPNPRGSFGQGQEFTLANRRDFGGGDLRDIMAGIDAVAAAAPVDTNRMGLMGHSYGGFMTMWGVTHTNRFKAAVAGAGIANWISYYGQNGIDQWMIPYFGASAYDDPAIYRQLSPIESIKAARTPTLVYVGERDVECPPAQSMEFWHGLKAVGVQSSLVIYDEEGHSIRKPEHQQDLRKHIVDWFDRYLGE